MSFTSNRKPPKHPTVYAMLWVSRRSVAQIAEFFVSEGIPEASIEPRMHLTVYQADCLLPGLPVGTQTQRVRIEADTDETRFMVFAPGGIVPQPNIDPAKKSVGIRLRKPNEATDAIQALRRQMCQLETPEVIGNGKRSTAWKSRFGARKYLPHVLFLQPGSGVDRDLTPLGTSFRSQIRTIEFGRYQVITRLPPSDRLRTPLGAYFDSRN